MIRTMLSLLRERVLQALLAGYVLGFTTCLAASLLR